ncbi:MAG: EamA family transporter RarD [Alkalispirochaeta sp.]
MNHSSTPISPATAGVVSAVFAFTLWGVLPLYWDQIAFVPALEVIWHRILWGGFLAWLIVWAGRLSGKLSGRLSSAHPAVSHPAVSHPTVGEEPLQASAVSTLPRLLPRGSTAWLLLLNGLFLTVNWFVYVWAVTSGRTLEASLGYYINPLVSVLLGMVFFTEKLTIPQWVAVGSAATGVLYMTFQLGSFPWVSVVLAGSFGMYGAIKKKTVLSSIHGLAVELTPFMVIALVMILRGLFTGAGSFANGDGRTTLFLLGASAVTVVPLLLFGIAARRIRLADVGFLQYIAPTLMFLVAISVFHEPVGKARIIGFVWVWAGLLIYTGSNLMRRRHRVHRHL